MASFSAEDDLDKVWAETIARVNKITKWDLNEKNAVTIDQVLAKLNPPPSKDGKYSEMRGKAKTVFHNTLICVQRFGNFAANAASMVFGPSQQAFNAISFVITAVQQFDAVFANITALMERVSVFMEKLRIYLDDPNAATKLDKRLRLTVYRVLDHFLTILGLSHKLTHGWKGKLKLAVEIGAFGKDTGIQDSMARLETLISDVTSTEITVIVKDLSEAARNIRGVDRKLDQIADAQEKTIASLGHLEVSQEKTVVSLGNLEVSQEKAVAALGQLETAERRRTADEEESKRLKKIKEDLNIDEAKIAQYWVERQDEFWGKHIPDTGRWLLNFTFPSFSRWANHEDTNVSVLSVRAKEGYGKSYLCSLVIHHLLERYAASPRVGVAYYYFHREDKEKNPVNKAVKAIIWQLASARTALGREYSNLVQKACDRKSEFGKTSDLWQILVSDIAKSLTGTFYIVLDGVDETKGEDGRPLASIIRDVLIPTDGSQLTIRIFLTGRPGALEFLSEGTDAVIPQIKIEAQHDQPSLNQEDILLYAEAKLNNMDIFKNENDEKAALKERAKIELGKGVQGDYFALDYKLDSVEKSRNFKEVEEILKLAQESRTQAIAREIDHLNETLRPDEIREVNQLLGWDAVAQDSLTAQQYEAMLSLNAETQSLISLEKQIRDRYSSLFDIDDSKIVTLRSADIRDYLTSEDDKKATLDDNSKAGEVVLREGEISLVKRILKKHFSSVFGGDDIYEKFAFEDFFASKLGNEAVRIRMKSKLENECAMIQDCLTVMCDHNGEDRYAELLNYCFEWWGDHLAEVIEQIDEIALPTLQNVGRKLVRLLRETALIDAWWSTERMWLDQYWVYDDPPITAAVYKWLKHPTVHKGLADMPTEREWVVSTTADEGPSAKVLAHVAKRMAQRWFDQSTAPQQALYWLCGYLSQMQGDEVDYNDYPDVKEITQAEQWSKETLENSEKDAQWHSTVARALLECDHYQEAATRFRAACDLLPEDLQLVLELTQALSKSGQAQQALETLQKLVEQRHDQIETDESFKAVYLNTILVRIGELQLQLQDYGAAELTHQKILDESMLRETFEDFAKDAVLSISKAFNNQGKHKQTIAMLDTLEKRQHQEAGSWLYDLLHYYAVRPEFHTCVLDAADHANEVETVMGHYRSAMDRLDSAKVGVYLSLRHFYADILWSRPSSEAREAAIDQWETDLSMEMTAETKAMPYVIWAREWMLKRIAEALLNAAQEVILDNSSTEIMHTYAQRLESITSRYTEFVYLTLKEPRLCLARLRHLSGQGDQAKDIMREYVKHSFKMMEEKEKEEKKKEEDADGVEDDDDDSAEDNDVDEDVYKRGVYRLASVLQCVDDDTNAAAAWCLFTPKPLEDDEGDDTEEAGGNTSEKDEEANAAESGSTEQSYDSQGKEPEVDSASKLVNGVAETTNNAEAEEQADPGTPSEGAAVSASDAVEPEKQDTTAKDAGETPHLEGILDSSCDGRCGATWTYVSNIYSCKDCLDVQFEPDCYAKLLAGTLERRVCSSKHSFLYLPPFDVERWKQTPADQMWVGDEMVAKAEWKEGIKRMWLIDEETLKSREQEVAAAKRIQKAWRRFRLENAVRRALTARS